MTLSTGVTLRAHFEGLNSAAASQKAAHLAATVVAYRGAIIPITPIDKINCEP